MTPIENQSNEETQMLEPGSGVQETTDREPSLAVPTASVRPVSDGLTAAPSPPPLAAQLCPTCGSNGATMPASYVYALGRIEPRFPRLSVEKEFAQATGRAETVNLTNRQALQRVLQDNRYLAKQLCWVMTVSGLETYIVVPRDPTDLNLLVETLRPSARPGDIDLVVGMRGPLAPPEICNGLVVPIVAFDQLYSFDRDSLIASIPRPDAIPAERFGEAAAEVFDRIIQTTDNAGATDEHRALNYLTVRYPVIYAAVADAHGRNLSLTAVDVRPSALTGVRKIVDVIFSFTNRTTDVVEKQFLRVDVTEQFPFLVTKLSPYYDR
jgi:PatG Domain